MSRIGKLPIILPEGIVAEVQARRVTIKGPRGNLEVAVSELFSVREENRMLVVEPKERGKRTKALWGTARVLIANAVEGVRAGFEKTLELEGIGYKAALEGKDLVLQLGFSHPVKVAAPSGISFAVEKNAITIAGIDKQQVGQIAASIRALKKPEPYKGKGIRYRGEVIRRKAGKKATGAK